MKQILVTGTGRCGTGFVAKLLTSAGVNCTHEGLFTLKGLAYAEEQLTLRRDNPDWGWRAESSWLAAPLLDKLDLSDVTVVHLVRHPRNVIESQLRLMLYTHPRYGPYYQWMAQYIPEIETYDTPEAKAAYWYIRLNELAEPYADVFHRIEDEPTDLLNKLGIDWQNKELFSDESYNSRSGYGPALVDLDDFLQTLHERLIEMSVRYGYTWTQRQSRGVDARWIDGHSIKISPTAAMIGGAWQLRDDVGIPLCYDANLVKFFFNKTLEVDRPVVVDVGASTGNFTLLPVLHDGMTVHAFEPNPLAFRALQDNVALNELNGRVALHRIALSDSSGADTLHLPAPPVHAAVACLGGGKPRDRGFNWREIPVDVKRLDDYDLAPDFIKVDVEGAELMVLRGAEQTIRRHKPGLLVEYTSLNTRQFGYEREDIIELLKAWGYSQFREVGLEDLWAEP